MIKKIMEILFGWKQVLITNDMEEYARVRGKLIDNGIKSKTKIIGNSSIDRNSAPMSIGLHNHNRKRYELFVKKEEVHKAYEVIYKK